MFNLDEAIAEWRRQVTVGGLNTPEVLNELESHLREEVARQVRSGLNTQAAFEMAVRRLGSVSDLKREFEKVGETKAARARQLLKLVQGSVAVLMFLLGLFTFGFSRNALEMSLAERFLGLAAIAFIVLLIGGFHNFSRFLPAIPDKRIRLMAQLACTLPLFVWLVIFANWVLPRFDFTSGEVAAAVLWAMSPCAVLGGLIAGLDEAAHRQAQTY
jgi:hypothetical protein